MREWHHRCSICGKDSPQIHHIDHDRANNDPANLLPLCPNHHLTDAHDPTRPIDPLLLSLFRKHKDPQMFSSRFEPVFRRLKVVFFDEVTSAIITALKDLSRFVSGFAHGEYYHQRIDGMVLMLNQYLRDDVRLTDDEIFGVRDLLAQLLIEQLRYQDWPAVAPRP